MSIFTPIVDCCAAQHDVYGAVLVFLYDETWTLFCVGSVPQPFAGGVREVGELEMEILPAMVCERGGGIDVGEITRADTVKTVDNDVCVFDGEVAAGGGGEFLGCGEAGVLVWGGGVCGDGGAGGSWVGMREVPEEADIVTRERG